MNDSDSLHISRESLSRIFGISKDIIRKNEIGLGLAPIRITLNKRVVLYPKIQAIAALKQIGLVPKGVTEENQ